MASSNAGRRGGGAQILTAVDIGSTAVRVVQIEATKEHVRILRKGSASLAPDTWDKLPATRAQLAAAIKEAMTAAGALGSRVITALPRRMVTLKHARLPHGTPDQIDGMVRFEAQQYIPFAIEEVVLDYRVLSDESDDMVTVMVVAARKSLAQELLAAFEAAGVEVESISVSALALAELIAGAAVPTAVLEVDSGEIELAVVTAGRLLFCRSATVHHTNDPEHDRIALTAEVARSLTAYQNEHRALPVSQILVTGAAPDLPAIEAALSNHLETAVRRMTSDLVPPAQPEAGAFAAAVGLALQATGKSIAGVNLVPPEREERRIASRQRTQKLIAACVALLALALGAWSITKQVQRSEQERAAAAKANRSLEAAMKKLKSVQAEHDNVVKDYETVRNGLDRSEPAVDVLKAVSDSIPKGRALYLTQLTYDRTGTVTVHGNSLSETAATDLVVALQGNKAFKEVRLGYLGDAQTDQSGPQAAAAMLSPDAAAQRRMTFIIQCRTHTQPAPTTPATSARTASTRVTARSTGAVP